MSELRLGDVIDDYCIKCRRVTNHSIVSIVNAAAAKVRCRTCYHDHDYRHEEIPPSKKDLKKAELLAAALAGGAGASAAPGTDVPPIEEILGEEGAEEQAGAEEFTPAEETVEAEPEPEPAAAPAKAQKKALKTARKTARK
jgi:hypothetical protein